MSEDMETPLSDAFEQELYQDDSCLLTEPEFDRMMDFVRQLERRNAKLRGHLQTMVRELNHNGGRISEETLTEAERILGEGDGRV